MKTRFDSSGRCLTCIGGNLCKACQADGAKRDRALSVLLAQTVAGIQSNRIGRVCARFELESDEGGTWERAGANPCDSNAEISGYLRQMLVEAIDELGAQLPIGHALLSELASAKDAVKASKLY